MSVKSVKSVKSANRSSCTRYLARLLVVFQVIVTAAFPSGFVLAFEQGAPTIVICTSKGLIEVPDPDYSGEQEKTDVECPFGIQPLADTLFETPGLTTELAYRHIRLIPVADEQLSGTDDLVFPARAPPALL